ncbi:hypothetical protein L873DRAFT_1715673 [Choiromyces venosus 120613-1]|uniref:Uncharacterized protein n=1 Tax=Choiromyces venosus 120613-1 TaxID=1336337 RepID=A0A3N4J1T9_9PEZI|nr:hypothetical protein L873DRAFT_1715673 [Choiromyces venosus 120613-1]
MSSEDDYDGGVVLAGTETLDVALDEKPTPSASNQRKRKREKQKLNKQKNKEENKKPQETKSMATDIPGGEVEPVNEDMARMDPKLLADYVAQRLKRFERDLSFVELEDRYISESAFLDTTSFTSPRTLLNLPAYLESFSKFALIKSPATPGTPHTLILTSAALRATDLVRAVRKYQTKESLVAKLFAKHIKLKESITTCQTSRMGIGVGTPGRILDLLKEGVLKVDELKNVVIDASHVDRKGFGVFDVRETQKGVMEILGFAGVKARFESGEGRIMFY